MAYLTYGPYEPEGFWHLRNAYYQRRHYRQALEARIGMTDAGLEWLARVKNSGYPTPRPFPRRTHAEV